MTHELPRHRYLDRLQTLYARLHSILAGQHRTVRISVLGVDHTGHLFPDEVPVLASADLLTLELPTTPVRAFLDPAHRAEVQVRNIFWRDLLTHCSRHPFPHGVYGVNVNPHVRYLRGRLYYSDGVIVNDFEAPLMVVEPHSGESYALTELGGEGEGLIAADTLLEAMTPAIRALFERNGITHVGPRENPYGPGRHLVILARPPVEMQALTERVVRRLGSLADTHRLQEGALSRLAFGQYVEGFLLPVSDYYLVEQLLRHVIRAVTATPDQQTLQVTHVAGRAHLEILERYLTLNPSPHIEVETLTDPRFPLHQASMIPTSFARHLEHALQAVCLQGEEFAVDLDAAERMLDRCIADDPEDPERRVLLRAIWSRDRPPVPEEEFQSLANEVPL